jgi:hypothetical protein
MMRLSFYLLLMSLIKGLLCFRLMVFRMMFTTTVMGWMVVLSVRMILFTAFLYRNSFEQGWDIGGRPVRLGSVRLDHLIVDVGESNDGASIVVRLYNNPISTYSEQASCEIIHRAPNEKP